MKKLFTLLLTLLAITSLWAYDFQLGDLYYNITNDTIAPYTVEVTYQIHDGYVGHNYSGLTVVIIPETVAYNGTTYSVTSIGDYAFDCCSSLTSVTIPESVTSIGEWAFSDCSSLTSITIPNSITSIGEWAFSYCSKLTSMVVKRGNINYDSRDNCNAIIETATNTLIAGCHNTIIPNSTTSVATGSFAGCSSLTSITIPNCVTSIRSEAFRYCSSLVSVTIGNSVSSIEKSAFSQCPSITSIKVKTTNPIYDSRENCNAIIETKTNTLIVGCQNTTIPKTITSIGEWAFVECTSLHSIIIPNSVISIGKFAFWYCSSLTSVTIGNCVMTIGKSAFQDCDSLASLTIGNNVTVIEEAAFRNCFSLTSITIPNSVTSIGWGGFMECSALKSIVIPNSVTNIGNMVFAECTSLDTVTCLAMTPPALLGEDVFDGCDNPTLFVPCEALSDYQAHEQWGQFTTIECISSEETDTEDVIIESGTTTIQKIIRDGQLIILRDGIEYNAIGQEL